VLTGETGAGKSILIDALLLLLGGRAQTDLIQTGAETATVEACFELDPKSPAALLLGELGYRIEEDQIIVRRELSQTGRHRAFVNDSPATVGLLEKLGAMMVEIHGQHEHQQLLQSATQMELLDRFANLTNDCEALGSKVRHWNALREELESLRRGERDHAQKEDLYRFQLQEIDSAGLEPGEDDRLRHERRRLQHAGQLAEGLTQILGHLYDDSRSALAGLTCAEGLLKDLSRIDPELGEPIQDLETSRIHLEEAALAVRRSRDQVTSDPERLQEIDARLDALTKLKRKYGDSVEAILAYRAKVQDELTQLSTNDERIQELEKQLTQLTREIEGDALALSEKRERAAKKLEALAKREFRGLGMDAAQFGVGLSRTPPCSGELQAGEGWRVGYTGIDHVEFVFSNTAGEQPKPLARVASGGELSRTALGLKTVLAALDSTPVVIFDEVDSGIGGRVADAVGQKLRQVSEDHQVICVTHLAPIASYANHHLKIEKVRRGSRNRTEVTLLGEIDRVEEIARMLGGERVTETTLRHAREILAAGKAWKGG
jgi:DNA repair protein RecN (Recombination protein N)